MARTRRGIVVTGFAAATALAITGCAGGPAPAAESELSDDKVVIPMADLTDSLNVTVAAGIMLHHFTQVSGIAR